MTSSKETYESGKKCSNSIDFINSKQRPHREDTSDCNKSQKWWTNVMEYLKTCFSLRAFHTNQ